MVRINKCIELIQENQAIFAVSAPELTYDCGVEMSQTWADLIQFDFEHHPFDTVGLAQFMKGLRDCLLYTSPSPRDGLLSRMPSSA